MSNPRFLLMVATIVVFNLLAFAGSVVLYNVPVTAVLVVVIINIVLVYGLSRHVGVFEMESTRMSFFK